MRGGKNILRRGARIAHPELCLANLKLCSLHYSIAWGFESLSYSLLRMSNAAPERPCVAMRPSPYTHVGKADIQTGVRNRNRIVIGVKCIWGTVACE